MLSTAQATCRSGQANANILRRVARARHETAGLGSAQPLFRPRGDTKKHAWLQNFDKAGVQAWSAGQFLSAKKALAGRTTKRKRLGVGP
jgi:hypothetical protein